MLISIVSKINELNELFFAPFDKIISSLPITDWAVDAVIDSVHLLPFLFIVFVIIELLEFYYADNINNCLKKSATKGIFIGSIASILPQCGFSVIASGLYANRAITLGCLIAVYLATSDETIPILLATPEKIHLIIPIVAVKLVVGIIAGLVIDFVCRSRIQELPSDLVIEEGCCKHDIEHGSHRELFIHPISHTINVFAFILVITLIINFCLENFSVDNFLVGNKFLKPVIASIIGLIPNCAVSISITMMLIKGTISFGTAMSALLSNAGLGLLVLLKNNDFRDTLKIIFILILIGSLSGIVLDFFIL